MSIYKHLVLFCVFLACELKSGTIETFYGPLEVEEPVLIELIHSPALQRLKSIHQYGVAYYTTHREEYNRYDHSIGVFAILKVKGASIEEQIAGLLHDVSHTVFSHVGDWVFGKEYQEDDYQSTILRLYLAVSGVEEILNRHGFTIEKISPKRKDFAMLEQSLPNLSADRIDYNIQGAFFQNFLSKEEAQALFQDLSYVDGKWVLSRTDLAAKLTRFSLFMTENCWGSAVNYLTSRWLADAILHGIKTGLISWNEFHFGIDQRIWDKLSISSDPLIQSRMQMLTHPHDYFRFVRPDQADLLIRFRCRGIDPWIRQGEEIVRITSVQDDLKDAFQKTRDQALNGWSLQLVK